MGIIQGFPSVSQPFVGPTGVINQAWLHFLQSLWNRTGGASGGNLSAGVANVVVAPPGLTDLGSIVEPVVLLSNPNDHAINDFGSAQAGVSKRIIFQPSTPTNRATAIIIDNDRILGPNPVSYGTAPTELFTTGNYQVISCAPGDAMDITSLGATATAGGNRWQVVNYTPWYLLNYFSYLGSDGNSVIPQQNIFSIGPRGPGQYPITDGLLVQWQDGTSKVTLPTAIIQGGGDAAGKMFFRLAAQGLYPDGTVQPIQTPALQFGATGITFQPFIDDPSNPGTSIIATNNLPGWHYSPSDLFEGNAAIFTVGLKEAPSATGTGGTIFFQICKPSTITAFQRAWFGANYGNWVCAGAATLEAGYGVTGPWPFDTPYPSNGEKWSAPSGDCNWLDTEGWGNVSVIVTDITDTNCGFNAGIAMRLYGAHGEGQDFGSDVTSGNLNRYGVHSSNRTLIEQYVPAAKCFNYPVQPFFSVRLAADHANATGGGTVFQIPFDTAFVDAGSNVNLTTGVFTAPVMGNYEFSGLATISAAVGRTGLWLSLVTTTDTFVFPMGAPLPDQNGNASVAASWGVTMAAGATAYLAVTAFGGTATSSVLHGPGAGVWYTTFSGTLKG